MARLKSNGIEILRLTRETVKSGYTSGAELCLRYTVSIRSNGAIMIKRDHYWSDLDHKYKAGSWKRESKLPASLWSKIDRVAWIEGKRIALEARGYKIETPESERADLYNYVACNYDRGGKLK